MKDFIITFLMTDRKGVIKELYRTSQYYDDMLDINIRAIFKELSRQGILSDIEINKLKRCMILIEEDNEQ